MKFAPKSPVLLFGDLGHDLGWSWCCDQGVVPVFLIFLNHLILMRKMIYFSKFFYYLVLTHFYLECSAHSISEMREMFGRKNCIEGSLSSLYLHGGDSHAVKQSSTATIFNITSLGITKNAEKSSLAELNELAQFNELEYYFKLEKEDGPPHDRTFTVSLTLGEETFVSEGKSLKKAKQTVAAKALAESQYETAPLKEVSEENIESQTPTVLLNNLGAKLGLPVKYEVLDKLKQGILKSNVVVNEKLKRPYTQKLNESIYNEKNLKMRKDIDQVKGPFNVKVQVGDLDFYGGAHTIQYAKHDAASKALDYFIQNKDNLDFHCLKEGSEEKCKKAKQTNKSPVSLVYESAQLRKLDVEFEIIKESGPAHKKTFVTECRLGHLRATGEGHSKKESKRIAAESMLERITELEPISQEVQVNSIMKDKKKRKRKNKKNKMIKTKYDEISMTVGNIIDSVAKFGQPSAKVDNLDENGVDSKSAKKFKKGLKQKHNQKSQQDQILEISNFLNFEISFDDLNDNNVHGTLLSLHINPEYLCFGEGLNLQDARNKAADKGLDLLDKMGIYDYYVEHKYAPLEREIKEGVENIIHYQIHKEKEEL
ncbi:unnamed protein product [Phaedon cochleariae]|uniref:DRBM domain-containing protein n=1 Tax=Phaedon cochleariae TaxID=80249 RepID=A0A9P0GMX0_PHACE|nr:unnamed protein product [Phaedon cochleariae]